MLRVKMFTHTDLDGFGCALLIKYILGNTSRSCLDVEYCDYNNINQKVEEFLEVDKDYTGCLITDISISDDLAQKIDRINNPMKYRLFDHHATALPLNKYKWCHVEIEKNGTKTSGTSLLYDWMVDSGLTIIEKNASLVRFVDIVRAYDTWEWAEKGDDGKICKQINDLFYIYGRDEFMDQCLRRISIGLFPRLSDIDCEILDIRQREIDKYILHKDEQMRKAFWGADKVIGVVFAEQYKSELGNKLCLMHPDIDFVMIIDVGNKTASFRTVKENVNVGEIAKEFGGGGHAKAAGSTIDVDIYGMKKVAEGYTWLPIFMKLK